MMIAANAVVRPPPAAAAVARPPPVAAAVARPLPAVGVAPLLPGAGRVLARHSRLLEMTVVVIMVVMMMPILVLWMNSPSLCACN